MASGQNPWMSTKYAILGKQADAEAALKYAQAEQAGVQTGLLGSEAAARNTALRGQGAAGEGAGAQSQAAAKAAPGLAQAQIGEAGARSGLYGAQQRETDSYQADVGGSPVGAAASQAQSRGYTSYVPQSPLPGSSVGSLPSLSLTPSVGQATPAAPTSIAPARGSVQSGPHGLMATGDHSYAPYSKGTDKVPGKGTGKVDTQKAMLAPGEAVLNKAAAEHLGRHTIALLNALGEQKMGMDGSNEAASPAGVGATDQGAVQGFAGGTPMVLGGGGDTPGYAPSAMTPGSTYGRAQQQPTQTPEMRDGQGSTPGYAKGTSKVPGKKAAANPKAAAKGAPDQGPAQTSISPKLLAALMQMGGAGGGMPAPGAQQPMPMPMPMNGGPAQPMQ